MVPKITGNSLSTFGARGNGATWGAEGHLRLETMLVKITLTKSVIAAGTFAPYGETIADLQKLQGRNLIHVIRFLWFLPILL
jgi:hypothetical protein